MTSAAGPLAEGDARWDHATRERVDRLFRLFRAVAIALVVGGLVGIGAGALAFVRIGAQQQDLERQQQDIARLVAAVQAERFNNAYIGCLQQNDRNRATKAAFPPSSPKRSRELTFALIDALVPVRDDCDTFARTQVSTPVPVP